MRSVKINVVRNTDKDLALILGCLNENWSRHLSIGFIGTPSRPAIRFCVIEDTWDSERSTNNSKCVVLVDRGLKNGIALFEQLATKIRRIENIASLKTD